jgi:hypothetical protein
LLGPGIRGLAPGANWTQLNIIVPKGADIGDYSVDGRPLDPLVEIEAGYPVVWDTLRIPAATTSTVTVTYEVPNAIAVSENEATLDFTLWPQTSVDDDGFRLTIVPPDGFVAATRDVRAESDTGLEFEGTLATPRAFNVRLTPG